MMHMKHLVPCLVQSVYLEKAGYLLITIPAEALAGPRSVLGG